MATTPSPYARIEATQALQTATSLQGQGRLHEAEGIYRQFLAVAPRHFAALCGLGAVLAQSGRGAEATTIFIRAVEAADSAVAHLRLGDIFAAINQPEQASERYHCAVALAPDHAGAHYLLANILCKLGRWQEAIAHYQKAIAIDPENFAAHSNIGVALQTLGLLPEALTHYQAALALRPDSAYAQANLGDIHRRIGRPEKAIEHLEKALELGPERAEWRNNYAGVLRGLGRIDEAIMSYRRAVELDPSHAGAHFNLATAVQEQDPAAAIDSYQRALEICPDFAEAHNNLGNALQKLGRFAEAVAHYERATGLKPGYGDAHDNHGRALLALNRPEDAMKQFEKALAVDPSRAMVHNDRGAALLALGFVQEAQAAFETAAALAPGDVSIHLNLASYRRFSSPDDSRLAALEKLAETETALGEKDRIALNFALGKAYADLGQTEKSFQRLLEGNALKRRQVAYDEEASLKYFEHIRAVFTPDLINGLRGGGDPSRAPIFVVGMPRSGSTLIEQILASHPAVFGAGEISDFTQNMDAFGLGANASPSFPEAMSGLSGEQLRQLGAGYVECIGQASGGAERVVDKMLSNFVFVGLIHLAMPNARIIHARRHPVDTCLSCFSLLFTDDQPYTYDLGELGRFYRGYEALMDHWRRVLPTGVMIDVQYEDVVADLEGQARRLIAHCGLQWEEACLAFHESRRVVLTASVTQVREPIYASSIGRWRPYAAQLRPLLQSLAIDLE